MGRPLNCSQPRKFQMSKPKITLTTLYDILQAHTKRFDSMDLRLDSMDRRFDSMDQRLGSMDLRADSMESLQRTMAIRLISIESKLEEHWAILSPLRERVESLHGLVEKLVLRVDRFEQGYTMITAALRRLETNFDQFQADRLRERISSLEARVSALESVQS